MRRPSTGPVLIAAAGVLLLASAAFLALQNANTPDLPATVAEIPRVSLADARAAYDAGQAVFIDVRDANAYAAAHIPGALSIPLAVIDSQPPQVDPSTWIITYCT